LGHTGVSGHHGTDVPDHLAAIIAPDVHHLIQEFGLGVTRLRIVYKHVAVFDLLDDFWNVAYVMALSPAQANDGVSSTGKICGKCLSDAGCMPGNGYIH
jgi:hypothetical protein